MPTHDGYRLKCKSLILSRELRQADSALLWSDRHTWLRYLSRLKKIWNEAREHQRTIDVLQRCMQVQLVSEFLSVIVLMAVSPGRDFRC